MLLRMFFYICAFGWIGFYCYADNIVNRSSTAKKGSPICCADGREMTLLYLNAKDEVLLLGRNTNLATLEKDISLLAEDAKREIVIQANPEAKMDKVLALIHAVEVNVISDHIVFKGLTSHGENCCFNYELPLPDRGLKKPWYSIAMLAPGTDVKLLSKEIYTRPNLKGYGLLIVQVKKGGFHALKKNYDQKQMVELLKETAKNYKILTVGCLVDGSTSYQQLIDFFAACLAANIKCGNHSMACATYFKWYQNSFLNLAGQSVRALL